MNLFQRIALSAFAVTAVATTVACDYVRAGEVGVKVYTMGGPKGDMELLPTGKYWIGYNEDLYIFPLYKQTVEWSAPKKDGEVDESIQFQTKDNMIITADVGATVQIEKDKVLDLFKQYRKGVGEIVDNVLRKEVKNAMVLAASQMTVEEIASEGKVKFINTVKEAVRAKMAPLGVTVDDVFLLGALKLPPNIVAAIDSKVKATQIAQQREGELRETEAQAKKVQAEAKGRADAAIAEAQGRADALAIESTAQAKANEVLAKSLSNPALIKLKELEIERERVAKWNGSVPMFGGGTSPIVMPQVVAAAQQAGK